MRSIPSLSGKNKGMGMIRKKGKTGGVPLLVRPRRAAARIPRSAEREIPSAAVWASTGNGYMKNAGNSAQLALRGIAACVMKL